MKPKYTKFAAVVIIYNKLSLTRTSDAWPMPTNSEECFDPYYQYLLLSKSL
jgi:hypothetical protein